MTRAHLTRCILLRLLSSPFMPEIPFLLSWPPDSTPRSNICFYFRPSFLLSWNSRSCTKKEPHDGTHHAALNCLYLPNLKRLASNITRVPSWPGSAHRLLM